MSCVRTFASVARSAKLQGIFAPLVTPFTESGDIDHCKFEFNLQKYEDEMNLTGYVVGGSNSEVAALTPNERVDLVSKARELISSDKILIGGATAESTKLAIEMSQEMGEAGANAVLVMSPFYFKARMTEEAIYHHYTSVADQSPVPVILYNMPIVSGIDISIELLTKLAHHPNICGVKDTDVRKNAVTVELNKEKNFSVFAGSAGYLLPTLQVGGSGGIMALATVLSNEVMQLYCLAQDRKWQEAIDLQKRLIFVDLLIMARFGVPGLKAAMEMKGFQAGHTRAPIQKISKEDQTKIEEHFKKYGFL